MSGPHCLEPHTIAMRADTHDKMRDARGNSILVCGTRHANNIIAAGIGPKYAGTKVEYDQLSGSAHRRMPPILPYQFGQPIRLLRGSSTNPHNKKGQAVTNAGLRHMYDQMHQRTQQCLRRAHRPFAWGTSDWGGHAMHSHGAINTE